MRSQRCHRRDKENPLPSSGVAESVEINRRHLECSLLSADIPGVPMVPLVGPRTAAKGQFPAALEMSAAAVQSSVAKQSGDRLDSALRWRWGKRIVIHSHPTVATCRHLGMNLGSCDPEAHHRRKLGCYEKQDDTMAIDGSIGSLGLVVVIPN